MVKQAKQQHFEPNTTDIAILTQLQHYGGKTALLDFSYNLHIALFFACETNAKKDGRLYFFKETDFETVTEIDYSSPKDNKQVESTKDELIAPTSKNNRVIFQSSVFVHAKQGRLKVNKKQFITIKKEDKKPILDYLQHYHHINSQSIYNDLQGFIANRTTHTDANIEFYRGYTAS